MIRPPPQRIVSLISSATEIICAMGLRDRLVGISHECDYPSDIKGLPVLSEPLIDPKQPSPEIDKKIREIVRNGLSIYLIDTEQLEKLKPDLIVTQDQCEVCAVSLKDVENAVCLLTMKGTQICSLKPNILSDIPRDIRKVGECTHAHQSAERLVSSFIKGMDNIRRRVSKNAIKPRVACVEWLDPLIIAGGWMPELVTIAGGEPVIVTAPERFRMIEWDDLRSANPDIILLMPCGYTIQKTRKELMSAEIAEPLRALQAVNDRACYVCDGSSYFNRPGPRILDSAEILAALFHPEGLEEFRIRYDQSYELWT